MVRLRDKSIDIELALSLISLLRQYVPRMRMAPLYLTAGSQPESLRRTLVRLEFWHKLIPFFIDSWAAPLASLRPYVSSARE